MCTSPRTQQTIRAWFTWFEWTDPLRGEYCWLRWTRRVCMKQVNYWQRYSGVRRGQSSNRSMGLVSVNTHTHTHTFTHKHTACLRHSVSVKPHGADRAPHKPPLCRRWLFRLPWRRFLQQHNVPTAEPVLPTNTQRSYLQVYACRRAHVLAQTHTRTHTHTHTPLPSPPALNTT